MKILFLLIGVLFFVDLYAQDAPIGYTTHYGIRKYAENANPSADSLNANYELIDDALYDLIVSTDEDQLVIEDDVLKFSDAFAGIGTFTTTATTCTTAVTGMTSDDIVVVTPVGATYDADDLLKVTIGDGSFIVTRNSNGTSGLTFAYIWVKK
jgi:hypothetical protein